MPEKKREEVHVNLVGGYMGLSVSCEKAHQAEFEKRLNLTKKKAAAKGVTGPLGIALAIVCCHYELTTPNLFLQAGSVQERISLAEFQLSHMLPLCYSSHCRLSVSGECFTATTAEEYEKVLRYLYSRWGSILPGSVKIERD